MQRPVIDAGQWNECHVLAPQDGSICVVAGQHPRRAVRKVLGERVTDGLGDRQALGDMKALTLHPPEWDHLSPHGGEPFLSSLRIYDSGRGAGTLAVLERGFKFLEAARVDASDVVRSANAGHERAWRGQRVGDMRCGGTGAREDPM